MVILMIMSAIVIINMATNVTPGFQELLTILHLSMGLEVSDIARPQTTACLAELGHLKGTTNCLHNLHHHHHHHHHPTPNHPHQEGQRCRSLILLLPVAVSVRLCLALSQLLAS